MRLNREVPTLHEQEDRRDGRRSSNFDVKFDKLATSTKPVALASKKDLDNQFNDQISDPLTDNLRNRRNFNSNNNDEIRELRKVTAKPHRKYTAVTTSEKEFPQNLKSSSNCCFCCLCTCSRSRWNVTYKYLPPSMVIHEHIKQFTFLLVNSKETNLIESKPKSNCGKFQSYRWMITWTVLNGQP